MNALVIVDGIDVPHALEEVQPDPTADAPQDDCARAYSVNYVKNAFFDSNTLSSSITLTMYWTQDICLPVNRAILCCVANAPAHHLPRGDVLVLAPPPLTTHHVTEQLRILAHQRGRLQSIRSRYRVKILEICRSSLSESQHMNVR